MKLWLDDKRQMPTDFDTHVKTYQDAVNHIESGKVTHIGFDHDLGDENDPEIGNGYKVAKHIEERAYFGCIPSIIWTIQSDNGPGRKNIEDAMKNADSFWARNEEQDIQVYHGTILDFGKTKTSFWGRFYEDNNSSPFDMEFMNEVLDEPIKMLNVPIFWVRNFTQRLERIFHKKMRYTKADIKAAEDFVEKFKDLLED